MPNSTEPNQLPNYQRKPGKYRRKLVRKLADIGFPTLHRLLTSHCNVNYHYHPEAKTLLDSNTGVILAWWHEYELALLPHGSEPSRSTLLLSPSKDGRILAKSAKNMGYTVIAGSSRRGGGEAMTKMATALEQNQRVIITPDGPLGPRHIAKPGAVKLAANSGCAIVPVAVKASNCYRKNSWDKLVIPLIKPMRKSTLDIY